ncbi:type II toxin-antitoxin system prevent-host-death family antitoxin [Hyphococcus sp.]|uniref:type II toxin-antitoxin system prevent-host-death family antitoxin n=1 Tax=Hyphococcus sp. TaxID=2038636 RepID=UPI0035C733D4
MSEAIPATEFTKHFGRYKDKAIAERVVEVSSNGRPIGAFLSQDEYERYLELKRREVRVYTSETIPEELLEQIARAEPGVIER